MLITYQCPMLLLHHGLDVTHAEASTDRILDVGDLVKDLFPCYIHHCLVWTGDIDVK